MAREPGVFVEPMYQRLVKMYCHEKGVPQTKLAEELGISYPTLNRAINKTPVTPRTKAIVEDRAKIIAGLHSDLIEKAMYPPTERQPVHIMAARLMDFFDLKDMDQAKKIARNLLRGMQVFV